MKYSTYLISCLSAALFLTSCGDFLEEQSQDEVIPKTTVDYRELLMGSGYYPKEEPANFLYYMDDDVDFNIEYGDGANVGSSTATASFPTYTWQPWFVDRDGNGVELNTDPGSSAYGLYYKWIMGCNAVLDNVDGAIGTQQERDRIKAEALAVRALYYFKLVNLYGEPYTENPEAPGVPLKLNSGIEEAYTKRNTVGEVYDQIVHDLKEALVLMEPLEIVRKDYHINQPAMHILLSRVYLYMENWQACIDEAGEVFSNGGKISDLQPYVAAPAGDPSASNTYLTYDNPEVEWVFGGNTQPEQSTYIPHNGFIASFDANDKRLGFFSRDASRPGINYYLVSKLPTGTQLAQTLRTSEALLNRAEAYAQMGQGGKAMDDLNLLRRNRITDYTNESIGDPQALLAAIRDERRKEFCYEGFRWFDLRRYGMPAISHRYQAATGETIQQYVLAEKDPMYTLPFPNSLIVRNPDLQQNPSATMGERSGN